MAAKLARLAYRRLRFGRHSSTEERSFTMPSTANCKINYLKRQAANLRFQIIEASAAEFLERCLLTATASIQLVILTPKFRLEVLFASSCFADFGGFAGVCGGSSLPGTG